MSATVWLSERNLRSLGACLQGPQFHTLRPLQVASSASEVIAANNDPENVIFLDDQTLAAVLSSDPIIEFVCPVILVWGDSLAASIGWMNQPWISHIVGANMLEHPYAPELLANVIAAIRVPKNLRLLDWTTGLVGRRVKLAQANIRDQRIEKMTAFFEEHGVGTRTLQQLRDVAEELLTNAFYDAGVAANVIPKPVSRTQEITLPEEYACDLAYGFREDLAIVRVRDPFGSLPRERLVEVLVRCARANGSVEVDESMGGAGLGMWRIFSVASFVAISVVKGKRTEILVGILLKRQAGPKPFSFHLYFRDRAKRSLWQRMRDGDHTTAGPSLNRSVVLVTKPK